MSVYVYVCLAVCVCFFVCVSVCLFGVCLCVRGLVWVCVVACVFGWLFVCGRLLADANSGHGIWHRNMFHFFRVACDAQSRRIIIHACTCTIVVMRNKSARCTRVICRAARVLI